MALSDPAQAELRARFAIHGSTARFWTIPNKDQDYDPDTKWRPHRELLEAVEDHLLHKWQMPTHGIIRELFCRSDAVQRALVLWRSSEETRQRIHEKGWWKPTLIDVRRELAVVQAMVADAGIPFGYVDASQGEYRSIHGIPAIT